MGNLRIFSFANYFAGQFDKDIAFERAKTHLLTVAADFKTYLDKIDGKSNARREQHEKKLYDAAKIFIKAYEAAEEFD